MRWLIVLLTAIVDALVVVPPESHVHHPVRRRRHVAMSYSPTFGDFAAEKKEKPSVVRRRCSVSLPHLSLEEEVRLGQRGYVERQRRKGGVGDAFIVVDSKLSMDEIWTNLANVQKWHALMRGVKTSRIRETKRDGSVRAQFTVTKLRLPANIVLQPSVEASTILFNLDNECTNIAIDSLTGFWHCEPSPNGGDRTRVWLAASVAACAIVPNLAIDYVASKALRRATNWLIDYSPDITSNINAFTS